MSAAPVLELRGFTHQVRSFRLGPLDWRVEEPALIAMLGRNGSGKSTLLKLVAGVLDRAPGARGELRLGGADPRRWTEVERARATTYLGSDLRTEFPVTVEEALRLGRWHARNGAGDETRAAAAAAEWAGIGALLGREVRSLSGGERQRVNLARAHAQDARLWLLDEALSALDLPLQAEFAGKLAALAHQRGITVLWVSHDLNFALAHAERAAWLAGGRLVAAGTMGETVRPDVLAEAFPGVAIRPAGSARARVELGLPE